LRGSGKLVDQVALITGGDSGIGAAVAVLFAREGADVAIAYLPAEEEDANNVKALVDKEGRRCLQLTGDVRASSFSGEAVERTVTEFGRLDVLVTTPRSCTSARWRRSAAPNSRSCSPPTCWATST
jgi:NAD(P)-dependent dehydrogenase (short-subunit alcohol dehydrogenase family)